ncbi:MAG: pyridoxamine 5'-phosphate oxidase family protein [Pseudomonadota bacterium]
MSDEDWHETLPGVLNRAWELLIRGAHDAKHPARTPTLATMSAEHGPQARTLVMRQVDRQAGTVTLFTDAATPKVTELKEDPRAQLHIWDKRSQIQLRLSVEVSMAPGAHETWQQMPEGAREVYGVEPAPGTPIAGPEAFDRTPNEEKFLELTLRLTRLELVTLGLPIHRRAAFRPDDGWAGEWLAP